MKVRDMALAALANVIWGFTYVAYPIALESFTASQMAVLRFLLACLPVVFVSRPAPWRTILAVGATLLTGQFLLLFFALAAGLPPGLASVTTQMHAFFAVLIAAVVLREYPTRRQGIGLVVAFTGLVLIGLTVGADLPPVALALAMLAAMSWATGSILLRKTPRGVAMGPLMVWCSLVPPIPAYAASLLLDHDASLVAAVTHASIGSLVAVVFLGTLATTLAFGIWGHLMQRYPSAAVAPFALLSPCTGVVAVALIFGERFGPLRAAGMACILAGLVIVVLPWPQLVARVLAAVRREPACRPPPS
ncbi:EamA family transporter [Rhodoplanes sp. TEM]|uniref:EamA family transporter n=1 Tax=Rhodoplanes tepidamans TaxID=200616 RepID=A0ABT5JDQ2_RHOTP|nr:MULTISPECIES: EamA family transporter [Rhodoplanes]MDC7787795.1 EamA family transporter [Rhodoplanes tepidamans]MDC7987296.1 EamA family transporter [Rhodoplanes sp. TEM]MDQ0357711.1 O-acetylserine/cysteine efflux transporter [Rhodoplanes tepidamans]